MNRHDLILTYPYRQIDESDASQKFVNELFTEDNLITLADLVSENNGPKYVIVYEQNGNVLSFLLFEDMGSYIYLNLVATNRLFDSGLHPGTKLIELLDGIAMKFRCKRIELYSIIDKMQYYERLGYENTGSIDFDGL